MKRSSRCRVFVDTGARTSGRIGPDVIIVHSRKKKQDEEEEEEEECVCVTLSLVCIEFLKPSNVSSLHFHSFSPSHLFLSSSFISSSSFFTSFSNQFLSCHLSLSCSLHAFLLLLPLFVWSRVKSLNGRQRDKFTFPSILILRLFSPLLHQYVRRLTDVIISVCTLCLVLICCC